MYNPGSERVDIYDGQRKFSGGPMTPPEYPSPQPLYPQHPVGGGYPPPVHQHPVGGGHPPPVHQQPSTIHHTNTTVVLQQPTTVSVQTGRDWSNGLCSCFDDCGVCLIGFCSCLLCLPIIECQVSGAAGECCCVGICCPVALRTKIRTRHNIQGSIVEDSFVLGCCHYCAFCQMQREMKLRGM